MGWDAYSKEPLLIFTYPATPNHLARSFGVFTLSNGGCSFLLHKQRSIYIYKKLKSIILNLPMLSFLRSYMTQDLPNVAWRILSCPQWLFFLVKQDLKNHTWIKDTYSLWAHHWLTTKSDPHGSTWLQKSELHHFLHIFKKCSIIS